MAKKIRLLVVDDEEIIRDFCSRALRTEGFHVDTATNGHQGVEMVRKGDYDIVLLDLKMSLMDGMEALEIIKRERPFVEVIIITGYATVENAIEAMKKGAYDFLLKPLRPDKIRLVVKKCVEKITLSKEVAELKKINERLRQIQAMKNKFIAITSHELRTPVTHIKSYLDFLTENGFSEEQKRDFLDIIHSSVEDLENIVMDMYNIAQIDSDVLRLDESPVNLNELIHRVVKEYKIDIARRRLTVKVKGCERLPIIVGDRFKLKRAIAELLQNAIKYTPDGGSIQIKAGEVEDYLTIAVTDTGIGIPKEELGNIFEKFYEVQDSNHHSTSKTGFMGGGMGIGLTLVKGVIEAHGGRVKAESEPGKGSTFTLYLPLTRVLKRN